MTTKGLKILGIIVLNLYLSSLVFASSYLTSFSFDTTLKGAKRWFDGNNIAFEASIAKSEPWPHSINTTYTVTLYRDNGWLGKDKIGVVVLPRDSWGLAEWINVGPGNYYVYLSKDFDGIELVDKNVKFYNF